MKWHYALNGEQRGPVTPEEFDRLVAAGIIVESTLVWHEGLTGWQPLREARPVPTPAEVPSAPPVVGQDSPPLAGPAADRIRCLECGAYFPESEIIRFGPASVCAGCKTRHLQRLAEGAPAARPAGGRSTAEILSSPSEIRIGHHWDRAWAAFRQRPGLAIGATVVGYFIVLLASAIPLVSMVAPLFVQGPIFGGLFLVALGMLRNRPTELGTLFDGFRRGYWQLVLAQLVQGLLLAALIVPLIFVGIAPVIVAFFKAQSSGIAPGAALAGGAIAWAVIVGLAVVAISLLVGALWVFSLPLIADRGLAFWPAMEFSRKLAWRNFGGMVLFMVAVALMNLAGLLLFCFGMLITLPVSLLLLASLFDELCGDLDPAKA